MALVRISACISDFKICVHLENECIILLLLTLVVIGKGAAKESRLVNIEQGPVRGYKESGDDIFVFYSIPYATAPTGEHKYKAPLPPPTWSKPFEAVNKNITCPQINLLGLFPPSDFNTDVNCLIANVYVPDTKRDKLPVLVQVHGGAYFLGSGNTITLKNFVREEEIVVVNFNYRLGPHGFLCLGTPDAPGNAGMKDQVALLRWIKKNIANFGGNPDDVTLSGYSAGSSSVDLHILSPMSRGLYNKVIPESGASLSAFSVQFDPIKNAKNYAKRLNFTSDDIQALENFYKTVPQDVLHSINLMSEKDSTFLFSPCIERDLGEERFLADSPINILKNGRQQKLPMLFGFTEMDGLFRMPQFDIWQNDMSKNFSDFLPADLRFENDEEKEEIAQKIQTFFFGKHSVNNETLFRYIDYFTDVLFAYGTLRSIQLQVESGNNNIYLYEYRFVDESAPVIPHTIIRGAEHCAQTTALADGASSAVPNEDNLSKDYKNMKKMMRKMWANFIITGKPVPEGSDLPYWPPAQAIGGPHMSIDKALKLRGPLLQQRFFFWNDIYDKYYYTPSPPAA